MFEGYQYLIDRSLLTDINYKLFVFYVNIAYNEFAIVRNNNRNSLLMLCCLENEFTLAMVSACCQLDYHAQFSQSEDWR